MPAQPTVHQIAFLKRLDELRGRISYRTAYEVATATFQGHTHRTGDVWLPRDHRLWLDAVAARGWIDLVTDASKPDETIEITERGRSMLVGHEEPTRPGAP